MGSRCSAVQESAGKALKGSCISEMTGVITQETLENVDAALKAIKEHEKTKKEVTDALRQLSRNVEGIVVERMEAEMETTLSRMVGRTVIVGVGAVSLIMLATPLAPLSPVVGLAGAAIGYAIVGREKIYEMSVKSEYQEK